MAKESSFERGLAETAGVHHAIDTEVVIERKRIGRQSFVAAVDSGGQALNSSRGHRLYGIHIWRVRGHARVNWLLWIPFVVVFLLILALGFFEGRKAYWDHKLREICAKDGRVLILERVRIAKGDIDVLGLNDGHISVPVKEAAPSSALVYAESKIVHLRDRNPEVWREEWVAVRRADQKILARWISVSRVGGDFPSFAHPSYFGCPSAKQLTSDLERLFIVEDNSK